MRIFSGQPAPGRKHPGNYTGAIMHYVAGQERGDGIYCIVDLHAISVPYETTGLRASVYDLALCSWPPGWIQTAASFFANRMSRSTLSSPGCS